MAMWVMAVVGAAPCQCFSPGANQTTSPGRISSIGAALALDAPAARGDDEDLAEGMGVPRGAGAGLEGHRIAGRARRRRNREQGVDAHGSGEPFRRSFGGGLRTASFDFHVDSPWAAEGAAGEGTPSEARET